MDRTTDARWRDHLPPFDALTLATPVLATQQLHAAAVRLVGLLSGAFPDAALHTSEDWHEHDGFVSEPEPAGWRAAAAPPAGGDLDLTADRDVIEDVLQVLRETGIEAAVEPASEFFSRRWNG